jgi:two-component system, sensor histidine kinase and response regulator
MRWHAPCSRWSSPIQLTMLDDRASLLIVDDERGPTESLRMIFKPDYNVFSAPGGEEALEILHSVPIDVVTLDLRMPGMPGVEVMEHIKRFDPDIEVIVVTGYASLDSAIRGLRYRVFDYVTKPFDVPQISDLVQRAVERRRAAQRARRVKEDFLANLSHELRTPLSAIIGYNSILTEELHSRLNDDQRVAFDRIQANSQKLLSLIETVLLLNSLDAGELQLTPTTFDARETLRRAARHFAAAARQRGLQLAVEGDVSPLWVESDEHKLERVLWALIDNAVKFTPRGSIHLTARAGADGDSVEMAVRDTGIGVSEADISQLIDRLADDDPSGDLRGCGLGLGLRMAIRLTEFLGGSLSVRGMTGAGSQFSVILPRHCPAEQAWNKTHDA